MASENVNLITNIFTIKKSHDRDEVLLVITEKLFKWRYKIQTYRFVAHFLFNRNKILCIHAKALDSDFQLLSKMLIHFFNLGIHCA